MGGDYSRVLNCLCEGRSWKLCVLVKEWKEAEVVERGNESG